MIYGYARVSTATQGRDGNSLEEQVAALEKYGCQEIITEAFTGKTMERPKFHSLFNRLQRDDTLVVCKLDRFARTAIEGVQTVRELFDRGVKVHILNMGLIENTLTGNLILTVKLYSSDFISIPHLQTASFIQEQIANTPSQESASYGAETLIETSVFFSSMLPPQITDRSYYKKHFFIIYCYFIITYFHCASNICRPNFQLTSMLLFA